MHGLPNRRALLIAGALLASQLLSACVILPLPYHRHRPYVNEPYYGERRAAPDPHWRHDRERRDRGPY
jgi:hypothetical protein